MNKRHMLLCGYDKHNNLLFKIKKHQALFIIDFTKESVRLIKGYMSKSAKKKLRKMLYEYYDLKLL